jgi:gamma-glutamyltranspeptidase/glutathione hydrolase
MWAMLAQNDRYEDAKADERSHLLAEVSMRVFADGAGSSPGNGNSAAYDELLDDRRIERLMEGYRPDKHVFVGASSRQPAENPVSPVATNFVAVDARGSAVACRITLNGLFGVGRVAPGTGIVIGATPHPGSDATAVAAPVIIVDHNRRNFLFAAAASGGAASSAALLGTMARVLIDEVPLPEAMAAPRLYHAGVPDVVVFEPKAETERLAAMRQRGHTLTQGPALGRVNAIACRDGFRGNAATCLYGTDPRGHGLATAVQF